MQKPPFRYPELKRSAMRDAVFGGFYVRAVVWPLTMRLCGSVAADGGLGPYVLVSSLRLVVQAFNSRLVAAIRARPVAELPDYAGGLCAVMLARLVFRAGKMPLPVHGNNAATVLRQVNDVQVNVDFAHAVTILLSARGAAGRFIYGHFVGTEDFLRRHALHSESFGQRIRAVSSMASSRGGVACITGLAAGAGERDDRRQQRVERLRSLDLPLHGFAELSDSCSGADDTLASDDQTGFVPFQYVLVGLVVTGFAVAHESSPI